MYCLLYILKNSLYKKKTTPFPVGLISDQSQQISSQKIDKDQLQNLLKNIHDFKILTYEEIEQIKQLNDDDKMMIIQSYNRILEFVQIMIEEDK